MGFSQKSHDKRSDKETQSPMLRVFKEMIQREHQDPEKSNLLKEKQENTKTTHAGSRSKSDHKPSEASSAERSKRKSKKKMADLSTQAEEWNLNQDDTQSIPFQNERRDSWWLWKDDEKKRTNDNNSFGSCPLKRIISSEYACFACFLVLFLVSVAVVSTVVFRTMPLSPETRGEEVTMEYQLDIGAGRTERSIWNADLTNRLGSYAGLFGSGYSDSSFQDSNPYDDEGKISNDLAAVIDTDKISDRKTSEKLREFYKKLIETDAKIKRLKQRSGSNSFLNTGIGDISIPSRYKRSIKFMRPKHFRNRNMTRTKRNKNLNTFNIAFQEYNPKRMKTHGYVTESGRIVVENKRPLIQNQSIDRRRQFPKCSHVPQESKSHEKHLKHPFYKNSQRLDERLDHVTDKDISENMNNSLNLNKCNHKAEDEIDNLNLYAKKIKNKYDDKNQQTLPIKDGIIMSYKDKSDAEPDNFLFINPFTQSTTLENAVENTGSFESIQNTKVETKTMKDLSDHSSKFMAKIHAIETTTPKTHVTNEFKFFIHVNPEPNVNHHKDLYNQNNGHLLQTNKLDTGVFNIVKHDGNEDIKQKYKAKDSLHNNLIKIFFDKTTEKRFDTNLDYSEIIFLSTERNSYTTDYMDSEKYTTFNYEYPKNDWNGRSYNFRKILQTNEDDDTIGYEDLKDLAYEIEASDETAGEVDRMKNNENVPDLYNRNWKGPIPLYPDELNAIIKQAAIENIKIPENNKDLSDIDKPINEGSDTEYIEDYVDSKYDRLAQLAQAYSDYGVLNGKKEVTSLNMDKTTNDGSRSNMAQDKMKIFKGGFFGRLRKETTTPSKGIRFEIRPGKCTKDVDFIKTIQKHFSNDISDTKTSINPLLNPLNYALDKTRTAAPKNKSIRDSVVPKRTLKSVEYVDIDNVDYKEIDARSNSQVDKEFQMDIDESKNGSMSNMSDAIAKDNNTMDASAFFSMMADWFSSLAQLSEETIAKGTKNSSVYENSSYTNNDKKNQSNEVLYPVYDLDIIDNIGHRSRMLLSIEDKNDSLTGSKTEGKNDGRSKNELETTSTVKTVSKLEPTKLVTKNSTTETANQKVNLKAEDNTDNTENKTISKRSVSKDSNLVFWNDIYDEEYGVDVDNFEKSKRHKDSISRENFVKKPTKWFAGRMKVLADKFRSTKADKNGDMSTRSTERIKSKVTTPKPTVNSKNKRNIFSKDDTIDFAALTANMKKVVREAAEAVRQTRNLKVREDSQEETAASSLMQQLVRLMSDVVDFQVQQKTCSKLPADLQKFLEWLMSPSDQSEAVDTMTYSAPRFTEFHGYGHVPEKSSEATSNIVMPEDQMDDKTQCLGTIQAVQDLMREYDEMNHEDQSKMTGIKEYLNNQLDFLNRKVASLEELHNYKYYKRDAPIRMYRELKRRRPNSDRRIKRRINKFIKYYSKKHTRSTAGSVDAVTESKKKE